MAEQTERSSETVYRYRVEVETPIANRMFTSKEWYSQKRYASAGDVLKEAGAWLQRLESVTGREVQPDAVARVSLETSTTRIITVRSTQSRVEEIRFPYVDQYRNQFWRTDDA